MPVSPASATLSPAPAIREATSPSAAGTRGSFSSSSEIPPSRPSLWPSIPTRSASWLSAMTGNRLRITDLGKFVAMEHAPRGGRLRHYSRDGLDHPESEGHHAPAAFQRDSLRLYPDRITRRRGDHCDPDRAAHAGGAV